MPLVRDIMVRDPVVVRPDAALADVACTFIERNINSVIVCDEAGAIEGICTSRDIMRLAADSNGATRRVVNEVMTPAPITVEADEPYERAMELMDDAQVRHLPVVENGRLIGILSVRDLMHHRAEFLEDVVERQTADLRRSNLALLERDHLMQYHLELAGRIQEQLLPNRPPKLPGVGLAVAHFPHDRVSGDHYDFVVLAPDRLGLLIADASGHSLPAAFVSVLARSVFQLAGVVRESPRDLLTAMNRRLPELIAASHFITMWYGVLHITEGELTWATAGHPPPLLRRASGAIEQLEGVGDVIGVHRSPSFDERSMRLDAGDAIVLYTDGLLEASNDARERFGRERMTAALARAGDGAEPIVESVMAEVHRFCGVRGFDDDVTCIGVSLQHD